MPIIRIGEGADPNTDHIHIPPSLQKEEDIQRTLLESQKREREAERFTALIPLPGEVIMAQKKDGQDQDQLSTGGKSFEEAQKAYEEKLQVENADTSAGTITRIVGGEEGARFVPTADVYQKEQGERADGIPADNPLNRQGVGPGNDAGQIADKIERISGVTKMGDEYSAQHATGPSSPEGAAMAAASGKDKEAAKAATSEDKAEKQDDKDAKKASTASDKAAKK